MVEDSLVVSTRELFGGGFTRTLSDGRGLRIVVRVQPTYLAPGPGYDFDDDRRSR